MHATVMNRWINRWIGEKHEGSITADEWNRIASRFPPRTRGALANYAAHNYDVVLVGDRVLVATASGGVWYYEDGRQEEISAEEWDLFYPRVPEPGPATKENDWNRSYEDGRTVRIYPDRGGLPYEKSYLRRTRIDLSHVNQPVEPPVDDPYRTV